MKMHMWHMFQQDVLPCFGTAGQWLVERLASFVFKWFVLTFGGIGVCPLCVTRPVLDLGCWSSSDLIFFPYGILTLFLISCISSSALFTFWMAHLAALWVGDPQCVHLKGMLSSNSSIVSNGSQTKDQRFDLESHTTNVKRAGAQSSREFTG